MVTGLPAHTVVVEERMLSTGFGSMVSEDVADVVQLALEATTVYSVDEFGQTVITPPWKLPGNQV